ncbi:nucleoside-diphosphate kinase [Ceratobasidium sp. AG-Ba]|nr:nucleoside-diphosphate kinase [Ceratobasidium sp. AG-Ba]
MSNQEQSYIMVKPDGVQRGLVGEIVSRFEKRGFKIIALKLVHASQELLEEHYAEHGPKAPGGEKGFFKPLVKYMGSGPVVGFVIEAEMLKPGTIRGDYALIMGRNICHGSDTVENAQREIKLWFPEGITQYTLATEAWVYE